MTESEAPETRPGVEDAGEVPALHRALVHGLVAQGAIRTPSVEAAFLVVPRRLFLPGVAPERVYADEAIVTKEVEGHGVSSSSQPSLMARLLELLAPEPRQRVLAVGAGTGYNAALLAHLAR